MTAHVWLVFAGVLTSAWAQEISGTLFNTRGAAIPGARVLLMSRDYVKLAETTSGDHGEFVFRDVAPALYFVQAKKSMFQMAQQNVPLEAGRSAKVYLTARVAGGIDEFISTVGGLAASSDAPQPAPPPVSGKPEPFRRLSGRMPSLPEAARRRGVRGTVALRASVKTDGSVGDIVTLESPDPEAEQACREAFRQWRYQPMKLDGEPIETETVVVFKFQPQQTSAQRESGSAAAHAIPAWQMSLWD